MTHIFIHSKNISEHNLKDISNNVTVTKLSINNIKNNKDTVKNIIKKNCFKECIYFILDLNSLSNFIPYNKLIKKIIQKFETINIINLILYNNDIDPFQSLNFLIYFNNYSDIVFKHIFMLNNGDYNIYDKINVFFTIDNIAIYLCKIYSKFLILNDYNINQKNIEKSLFNFKNNNHKNNKIYFINTSYKIHFNSNYQNIYFKLKNSNIILIIDYHNNLIYNLLENIYLNAKYKVINNCYLHYYNIINITKNMFDNYLNKLLQYIIELHNNKELYDINSNLFI